jgi:putative oxidoreductase
MSAASFQSVRPTRRIGAWTLQGILAAAFLAAGSAKLAGVPYMVDLFGQIGLGQWFRIATGVVEVIGAIALLVPGLASVGALWLGFTMVCAVATHVFVLHTSPVPAIVLGVLNAAVVYLRRDELVALLQRVKG